MQTIRANEQNVSHNDCSEQLMRNKGHEIQVIQSKMSLQLRGAQNILFLP